MRESDHSVLHYLRQLLINIMIFHAASAFASSLRVMRTSRPEPRTTCSAMCSAERGWVAHICPNQFQGRLLTSLRTIEQVL